MVEGAPVLLANVPATHETHPSAAAAERVQVVPWIIRFQAHFRADMILSHAHNARSERSITQVTNHMKPVHHRKIEAHLSCSRKSQPGIRNTWQSLEAKFVVRFIETS